MPKETGIEIRDALLDTPAYAQTRTPSWPEHLSEDNQRTWSSACFRQKLEHSGDTSDAAPTNDPATRKPQLRRQKNAQRSATSLSTDGLFVPLSLMGEP